jgi:hypothetical protein
MHIRGRIGNPKGETLERSSQGKSVYKRGGCRVQLTMSFAQTMLRGKLGLIQPVAILWLLNHSNLLTRFPPTD